MFFFGLAGAGLIAQKAASLYTESVLLLLLAFFGFVTRRLSGGTVGQSILIAALAAGLGWFVVFVEIAAKNLPKYYP